MPSGGKAPDRVADAEVDVERRLVGRRREPAQVAAVLHQPVGHRQPRGGVVELDVAGERRVTREHDRGREDGVHGACSGDGVPVWPQQSWPAPAQRQRQRDARDAPARARPAARAPRWSPSWSRCDLPRAPRRNRRAAGGRRAAGCRKPARGAGRSRATPPSRRAETGASRREDRSSSRAPCIRARGRRLRYRVGRTCPLRASRRASRRRGVVDLDLHVAARECEVHAVRPVAAVDRDSATGHGKRRRIRAPRQPAQQAQRARARI